MNWFRRLFSQPSRGTLTLLDDGIVIGAPSEWPLTPKEAHVLHDLLSDWLASGRRKPLVLPWPIDVTDHRVKP